jgi:hypothetical protein
VPVKRVAFDSRDGPASGERRVSDGAAHMRVARHEEEVKGVIAKPDGKLAVRGQRIIRPFERGRVTIG